MRLRDFVPPVAGQALAAAKRWAIPPSPPQPPLFEPYPTYEAARAACGGGYDDADLADVVRRKTITARANGALATSEHHAHTLLALMAARRDDTVRVLDFGGACGASYFLTEQAVCTRWAVVETSAMVQVGRTLETDRLHFFTSIRDAGDWLGGVDLVHTSGALPYLPDPAKGLCDLLRVEARVVALLRTAYGVERRYETQRSTLSANGPGPLPEGVADRVLKYPRTIERESAMRDACERAGYRLTQVGDTYLWERHRHTGKNERLPSSS